MKLTRLMSLLLVLVLCASCFCGAVAEEPMTISYVSWNCGEIVDDNMVEKYLQDKFNVEIVCSRVDLNNATQKALLFSSGEMPECGWILGTTTELLDQGLVRAIPEDMVREYAPDYAALLDANPLGWRYCRISDGNYYGLTSFAQSYLEYMIAVRLDWMENLGIELPEDMVQLDDEGRLFVTNTAMTADEFAELLRAFTEDDPDGNGEDDTYGLSAAGNNHFFWVGLQSAFDFSTKGNFDTRDVNGEIDLYYVTPQYKEFLEYYRDLYAAGYLDSEFATIDSATAWEKYANGKVGVEGITSSFVSSSASVTNRPPMNIMSQDEGKVLLMPSLTTEDRTGTSPSYRVSYFGAAQFFVRADVDDDKLATILEIMNWCHFDEFGRMYCRYGNYGEHYTFENPDGPNGIIYADGVHNGGELGLGVFNSNYICEQYNYNIANNNMGYKLDNAFTIGYSQRSMKPYAVDIFGETNMAELRNTYEATISTLVSEFFYNAICGRVDIDAEWDNYVATLYASGYDKYHETLQDYVMWEDFIAHQAG